MPTREEISQIALELFTESLRPQALSPENAWLGIYQVLLWPEPIHQGDYSFLLHVTDSNRLRLSTHALKTKKGSTVNIWQKRAVAIQNYLAEHLKVSPEQVIAKVDRLLKHSDFEGQQRQNPLGFAFAGLMRHLMSRFADQELAFQTEVDANSIFPGITMPGRSETPSIDILTSKNSIPKAIISAKWSLRHDRINDITNECPIYKAAAQRSRNPLKFYVVTNEFDPARLTKILKDTCIDALIHVRKEAVIKVCELNGRLEKMVDLSDFLSDLSRWIA